jgi:hypothetical protein
MGTRGTTYTSTVAHRTVQRDPRAEDRERVALARVEAWPASFLPSLDRGLGEEYGELECALVLEYEVDEVVCGWVHARLDLDSGK